MEKFRIDHDLHIHSELSTCSSNPEQTAERLLEYARKEGLKKIAVTDHFWDEAVDGASDWYKPQNFAHISEILPLPEDKEISFLFGCEAEMDKHSVIGLSKEKIDKFDFIIVPTSHLHMKGFTIEESLTSVEGRAKYYMERCHALLDADLPFYKVGLAHFTCSLMARGADGKRGDIINAISDEDFKTLFDKAARVGIGIEINTSLSEAENEAALRPYRIAKECGCKFYLGSDAHSPGDFDSARERFSAMIDALALTEDDKFDFARV